MNDVEVKVMNERVMYYGKDGKLITESLIDYTKENVLSHYRTLEEFLNEWHATEKKKVIIEVLEEQGILFEELQKK